MQGIKLDISGTEKFVSKEKLHEMEDRIFSAHDKIQDKTG